jgi:hypothetical protein
MKHTIPLPRLTTARPIHDIGDPPEIGWEQGGPRGIFGIIGRRQVMTRTGKPTVRNRPGGARAEWEVPGLPGVYRNRKLAMKARRRALKLVNSTQPAGHRSVELQHAINAATQHLPRASTNHG